AELKKGGAYQEAEKQSETARHRLSELPEDKSLTAEQQTKLASELAVQIRRPTELRKQAEEHDPEMRQAMETWQAAGKKIAQLGPQLKKSIDSDPAVTKAVEQAQQTLAALEKARTAVTRGAQNVNTAQSNLDRQNEQLAAA